MESYYAQRAAEYDRIYDKPERQADLAELKRLLSLHFKGLNVLEIACGTGYWTQYIARSAQSVRATDYNREMLDMAARRDYGYCRVSFTTADAYALPPTATLQNAGFAGFLWSHVPLSQRAKIIKSFHAQLADGARVVWIDGRYVEGSSTPIRRQDSAGNTYQIRQLSNGTQHEVIKNYPSESELRDIFAPFAEQIRFRLFKYYWLLSYSVKKNVAAQSEEKG
jgi:ubiquinone/menaquinone biosynthesis C-methylase UbiE